MPYCEDGEVFLTVTSMIYSVVPLTATLARGQATVISTISQLKLNQLMHPEEIE